MFRSAWDSVGTSGRSVAESEQHHSFIPLTTWSFLYSGVWHVCLELFHCLFFLNLFFCLPHSKAVVHLCWGGKLHISDRFQFPCHWGSHVPSLRDDLVHAVFSCVQAVCVAANVLDFYCAHRHWNAFSCALWQHEHWKRACTESWWLGEKILAAWGKLNLHQHCVDRALNLSRQASLLLRCAWWTSKSWCVGVVRAHSFIIVNINLLSGSWRKHT